MGLFDFFKKKENGKQNENTNSQKQEQLNDFTNDIIKLANFCVNSYSDKFKGLDFSVNSLLVIDKMLEQASDFYEEINEKQQQNIINTIGSYVFEVARKNFGGRYFWYNKLNQPILVTGQPAFEVSILAFEKVKGRLKNGKEDNISFYFQGYVERVKNKQSGMVV
jgi:hypothetical protein